MTGTLVDGVRCDMSKQEIENSQRTLMRKKQIIRLTYSAVKQIQFFLIENIV